TTEATTTFTRAELSAPAAKKKPHDTKAAGTIRWKLLGRLSPLPRSPDVTQWKVKFRLTSTQMNARTAITRASGAAAFARPNMATLPAEADGDERLGPRCECPRVRAGSRCGRPDSARARGSSHIVGERSNAKGLSLRQPVEGWARRSSPCPEIRDGIAMGTTQCRCGPPPHHRLSVAT